MDFFKCSIAGVKYGRGTTEVQHTLAEREGRILVEEPPSEHAVKEPGFCFDDGYADSPLLVLTLLLVHLAIGM